MALESGARIDIYEVTVGQFREFVNQSGYSYEGDWDDVAMYSPGDDYPMIYVSWNDAGAYAKWAGKDCQRKRNGGMRPVEG